jgi:nicotinate-nucleotide adenylyltransferase
MRIGLLGGTFDPVHRGHLDIAHAARERLSLDVVWLVPARTPPHRAQPRASAAHRFAMVAQAVADQEGLLASDIEMDAEGPSYTVTTLERLAARGLPAEALFVILGADAFADLPSWKAYPAILDRAHFVVVSRGGVEASTVLSQEPALASRTWEIACGPPPGPSIFFIDAPTARVSSTAVRQALATGASVTELVPPAVAAHIARHQLYGHAE